MLANFPSSLQLQASFAYGSRGDAKKFERDVKTNCFINTFSIKNWITSPSIKNLLLGSVANDVIDEFNLGIIEPENIDAGDLQLCAL